MKEIRNIQLFIIILQITHWILLLILNDIPINDNIITSFKLNNKNIDVSPIHVVLNSGLSDISSDNDIKSANITTVNYRTCI